MEELPSQKAMVDNLTPNPLLSPRSNIVAPFLFLSNLKMQFNSDGFKPVAVFISPNSKIVFRLF
jgi:hypothetical protein